MVLTHILLSRAKIIILVVTISAVLFMLYTSFAFNAYAQQGGSATSGPATGGAAVTRGATCGVGATCNFYGGSATSGPAIGGAAVTGGATGVSATNVSALVDYSAFFINYVHNYTEAIIYADKALALNPNNKYALNNKGNAFLKQGNYAQALRFLDMALDIDPNYKDALTNKGNTLSMLDDYTQAIAYFDKILDIDPNYKDALSGKGFVLYYQNNDDQGEYRDACFQFALTAI
jgi:tetratricopeptide (TPR) repeat protein